MQDLDLIRLLNQQANEIAANGIAGWGNTMRTAADRIEELTARIKQLENELAKNKPSSPPLEDAGGGSGLNVELDINLRDYFAAKALQGLLTMPDEWRDYFKKDGCGSTWKAEAAKAAYSLADEMMKINDA